MRCGFISLGRVLTRAIVRHVPSSQCIFTSRLPGTTEREHKKSWLKAEYNIESLRRGYVERVCVWLILNGIGLVVSYTGEKKRNIGSVSSVLHNMDTTCRRARSRRQKSTTRNRPGPLRLLPRSDDRWIGTSRPSLGALRRPCPSSY
jgi:hypothetical protein